MIVCANCKKEMNCIKNGSYVRFKNGHHVYAGDQYQCNECGATVNVTNGAPYFDPRPPLFEGNDVWMD